MTPGWGLGEVFLKGSLCYLSTCGKKEEVLTPHPRAPSLHGVKFLLSRPRPPAERCYKAG